MSANRAQNHKTQVSVSAGEWWQVTVITMVVIVITMVVIVIDGSIV